MTTQPCAADLRRPFLGDVAAGRHEADVGVGEVVVARAPCTFSVRSPKETSVPTGCGARRAPPPRRRESRAPRGCSSISRPTLPVAPTTATLNPIVFSADCQSPHTASRARGNTRSRTLPVYRMSVVTSEQRLPSNQTLDSMRFQIRSAFVWSSRFMSVFALRPRELRHAPHAGADAGHLSRDDPVS